MATACALQTCRKFLYSPKYTSLPGIENEAFSISHENKCQTKSFCIRILILHRQHHDTHTDSQKKMQIGETFRGVAILMIKKVSHSNFCSR